MKHDGVRLLIRALYPNCAVPPSPFSIRTTVPIQLVIMDSLQSNERNRVSLTTSDRGQFQLKSRRAIVATRLLLALIGFSLCLTSQLSAQSSQPQSDQQ